MSFNRSLNYSDMDIDEITEEQIKSYMTDKNNHRLIKSLIVNLNKFSHEALSSIINDAFNNKTLGNDRGSEFLYLPTGAKDF